VRHHRSLAVFAVLPAVAVVAAALSAASPLEAQQQEPKRPRLHSDADTNNAATYYLHGVSVLSANPAEAADAFYWAARINPAWAYPLYARRVALLMSEPRRLVRYFRGSKGVMTSREVQYVDSLYLRALALDPFFHRGLEKKLVMTLITTLAEDAVRREGGEVNRTAIDYWINTSFMLSADPELKGWLAYSEGRFPAALQQYGVALKRARYKAPLRAERARMWVLEGTLDSALAELTAALSEARGREEKELVPVYESKALYEHSTAVIHEKKGNLGAAREAYGRALVEDLAYYPAHTRLAFLAFETGDTATALTELDLAVQLAPDDPMLRFVYGHVLAVSNRLDEAATQLNTAIEVDPHYAAPYYLLASVREVQGQNREALELWKAFVARASSTAPELADAKQRVAELSAR
jgi:tetratricopeptide (TPR) repeat protein